METIEELAYIAGLFDGEGTIMISRLNCKNRKIKFQYQLRVSISNSNKDVLELVKTIFGGKVYWNNQWSIKKGIRHKRVFRWAIYSRNAEMFLHSIFPYLKIKRLQAETAFIFRETIDNRSRKSGLSSEIQEKRAIIRLDMQELNRKGA